MQHLINKAALWYLIIRYNTHEWNKLIEHSVAIVNLCVYEYLFNYILFQIFCFSYTQLFPFITGRISVVIMLRCLLYWR